MFRRHSLVYTEDQLREEFVREAVKVITVKLGL
jgi:hypothetical protein